MTAGRLFFPAEELKINLREVASRLRADEETAGGEEASAALAALLPAVCCRGAFLRVPVRRGEDGLLDFGFGAVRSFDLTRNLSDCSEAFLFAVTLGAGVDRLLLRLSHTSPAKHFLYDGLASALAEAACDRAEEAFEKGIPCRPRFSPGYGDLPLSFQPALLAALDAGKLAGITLNRSLLMSPMKSITAIVGILP